LLTTKQRIFLPSLLTFQARGGRENSPSTGGALSRQWELDDPRTTKQHICRVIPSPLPEEVQREGNGETTAKVFITAPLTGAVSRKNRVKVKKLEIHTGSALIFFWFLTLLCFLIFDFSTS
jgi:hypothetical protein